MLHLLAMAHSANIPLSLDDFTRIGKRVPVLADLKPSGKYLMSELVDIGGQTPLMKMLLEEKILRRCSPSSPTESRAPRSRSR